MNRFATRSAVALLVVVGLAAAPLMPSVAYASPTYRFVASYRLPAGHGGIADISCVAANDCVIVGGDLARTFDGHATTPIADLDGDGTNWFSVSCTKLGACMIFGVQGSTLVSAARPSETSAWTSAIVAPPSNDIDYGNLGAVSCASATFCLAVENYWPSARAGVVFRWDGSQWHRSSLRPSMTIDFEYNGVSCAGAWECVVTGFRFLQQTTTDKAHAFREVLDGNTWHVANLPGSDADGEQVSCWAVHHCIVDGFVGENVAAWRWSGGDFSPIAGFTPTNGEILHRLSCTSASFCVAAGEGPGQGSASFVLLWNGSSWKKLGVHVPPLGSPNDTKDVGPVAAACSAAYSCWLSVERSDEQTGQSAAVIDTLAST